MLSTAEALRMVGLRPEAEAHIARAHKRVRPMSPNECVAVGASMPIESFSGVATTFPPGIESMAKGQVDGPILVEVTACVDTSAPLRPSKSLLSTSNFSAATEDTEGQEADAGDAPRLLKLKVRDASSATVVAIE